MNSSISEQITSIGIIADTTLQQHLISALLTEQGIEVAVNTTPWKFTRIEMQTDVDLWYVDLTLDEGFDDFLDLILEAIDVPVLIGDGQAPSRNSDEYPRWKRRFMSKLSDQVQLTKGHNERDSQQLPTSRPQQQPLPLPEVLVHFDEAGPVPERVWVIGASLGGPGVVKEFLDALPAGLPVAFVYAQHIDAGFQQVLADTVGRHSCFDVVTAAEGEALEVGKVVLAPVEQEILFTPQARMESTGRHWTGPYQPNIGQVMMSVLRRFGEHSGAIIFTGMGEDGVDASLAYQDCGATVWTQNAESSASSTMPDAICEQGHCSYRGSPRELAARLVAQIADEVRLSMAHP